MIKMISTNSPIMENQRDPEKNMKISLTRKIISTLVVIFLTLLVHYFTRQWIVSLATFIISSVLAMLTLFLMKRLRAAAEIKKMEIAFPDFLELMSSNLRAGMTIDRALLLSSREEFAPLDKEIVKLGKDLVTGKEIERALLDMAARINSEKIHKTLMLISAGIRSGGNLATLLQETSTNMREREFVEKRAASNVLMYVIFIFFAIAVGGPVLFSLSTVLVKTLSEILATIPPVDSTIQLPFTLTKINISPEFITYFSVLFIIVTNVLGSLVLGMVNKGDEKAGAKYIIPLIAISLVVFFVVRIALSHYFSGFFG